MPCSGEVHRSQISLLRQNLQQSGTSSMKLRPSSAAKRTNCGCTDCNDSSPAPKLSKINLPQLDFGIGTEISNESSSQSAPTKNGSISNSNVTESVPIFGCPECPYHSKSIPDILSHLRLQHNKELQLTQFLEHNNWIINGDDSLKEPHTTDNKLPEEKGTGSCLEIPMDLTVSRPRGTENKEEENTRTLDDPDKNPITDGVEEVVGPNDGGITISAAALSIEFRNLVAENKGKDFVVCRFCHLEFDFRTKHHQKRFRNHMEVHYGHRPFPCEVCGEYFKTAVRLITHFSKHSDEGKGSFECAICAEKFKTKTDLLKHNKTCTVGRELN